jgi:hypothetical protein
MTSTKTEQNISAFRGPRDDAWRDLSTASEGDENKTTTKENQEKLYNMLFTSMQMQHLVILAGSGCSIQAGGPSMGDLWSAVVGEPSTQRSQAAAKEVGYKIAEKNIEAFLSRIEAALQLKEDTILKEFLNDSKKVILEKCSCFLEMKKLQSHRTFLHRLSRRRARDQRLKVFTTNYDLCFERAASLQGEIIIDGFSFSAPRHYDPLYFNYDIIRRSYNGDDFGSYLEGVFLLHKLHGSVNWARKDDGVIQEVAQPTPEEACLIYPASGKYQQSFTQPYLESLAQYLAAIRQPNTCLLVAGFGFNDDHLSEPLLAAATSNPHLRLIIVDHHAKENHENGNAYWNRLAKLNLQGEDIWFINSGFEEFSQLIPDLKSLTPAETLIKAINSATRDR